MADEYIIEKKKRSIEIEQMVCDTLIERPITFKTSKGRFYYLYQPSIGIQLLSDSILRNLGVDQLFLAANSTLEMMRIMSYKRNDILRLIAYHSFKRRSDAMIEELVEKRIEEFNEEIELADLMTLFSYIASWGCWPDKIQEFYHIDKERETKEQVNSELSNKGGLVFGGKSIFGTLIDFACQRYGWQVGYVLWGVSANNLNMMMADSISTVTMTKEEMEKIGVSNDREVIDADDPANWQSISRMFNK